jgi:thiol-disulfide isomerase/thioredoxin
MYEIKSFDDLDNFIIDNNGKVILLYFGATWCDPCKLLKKKLSEEDSITRMPELRVCYIDIDINEEIINTYKINSLPTQLFVRLHNDKVKIFSTIEGYDYTKLLLEYDQYIESLE